jgi:diguanylate cyclase (GGDEF)-like protein/PAS domain S-box-containing protein
MQGTALETVLLLLLIVFFGIQQRRRPELFFRFWFVGWISVSLSFAVWLPTLSTDAGKRWQDVLCANLMLMGSMAFLVSFVATRDRLLKTVLIGMTFGIPAKLLMDARILYRPPAGLLGVLVLVVQVAGIHAVHRLLPNEWRWRRGAVIGICLISGVVMLGLLPVNKSDDLAGIVLAEAFLCVAVVYAGVYGRLSFAGFGGSLGFFAWGAFYLAPVWLAERSAAMRWINEFWNVPKYFVGFAMILQVFENSRIEFAQLAEVYRALYDDFRLMYDKHPLPMWIYEPVSRRLVSVNAAAAAGYGFSEEEMLGMRMTDIEASEGGETETLEEMLLQHSDDLRTRHRHKDGRLMWVNVVDRAILFHGNEARFVIARNVTRQLTLNRELEHRAHHDALTGLPNRVLLESRIQQCLDRCGTDERKAVLLTVDIDHFKKINDTYGHPAGDECLKAVAGRLKSKIRPMDTIARAGGEEFVAIVGGLRSAADARKVASVLLAMFETPLQLSFGVIPVTVSIGGAVFPDDGLDVAELQFKSDQALYGAKRSGRNRVVFALAQASPSLFEHPGKAWLAAPAEGVTLEAH